MIGITVGRLVLALAAVCLYAIPGSAAAQRSRGSLVIVGGGPWHDSVTSRFVRLAGGGNSGGNGGNSGNSVGNQVKQARIVVLPMASAEGEASGSETVKSFRQLGAEAVSLNITREEAGSDSVARILATATGIWFPGGDQSRLAKVLLGTRALDSVRARFRAGAVVGGTSAGAAVMSDPMITGDERRPGGARPVSDSTGGGAFMTIDRDNIVVAPGFGFLSGVTVDQHFIRRRRHNRLLSRVIEAPRTIGVGIDESTALVVSPSGEWEVVGASQVVVYDARRAKVSAGGKIPGAVGIQVHVLPAGSRWNPATGVPRLPAR